MSGVGPVCWMAPESIAKRIYSKKSDVWSFAIVGECVCVFVCVLSHLFTSEYIFVFCYLCLWYLYFVFECWWLNWERNELNNSHSLIFTHFVFVFVFVLIDMLLLLLLLLVYEIVAQCEPHKDNDAVDVAVRIRFIYLCSAVLCWESVCVRVRVSSIHTFLINTHNISTEMKDWHQRFLETVQRNLHNWWKCVGTKIPINVLYPLPLSLSIFSIFSNCVCVLICETQTLIHSHIYWREVKWVSLFHFSFSFLLIVVFLDLKHTNWKNFETICAMLQQQWNEVGHTFTDCLSDLFCLNVLCYVSCCVGE
jgi:serine/threonine protein kinase